MVRRRDIRSSARLLPGPPHPEALDLRGGDPPRVTHRRLVYEIRRSLRNRLVTDLRGRTVVLLCPQKRNGKPLRLLAVLPYHTNILVPKVLVRDYGFSRPAATAAAMRALSALMAGGLGMYALTPPATAQPSPPRRAPRHWAPGPG